MICCGRVRSSVIAIPGAPGFAEVRQRGSREQLGRADERATTVPHRAGGEILPIPLRLAAALGRRRMAKPLV
jgi:predicted RNA binding protein YcfA (HicA-like mRNA interferase family)